MKCKKHHNDYTSEIGVCASCLRERLFALISDQAREERKELEVHQRPLILNRSVSPYACRRNLSSANSRHHGNLHHSMSEQQFFSTPQAWTSSGDVVNDGDGLKKKKKSRFSVFSKLFRSKSDKVRMEATMAVSNSGDSDATSSTSPSWFTTMLSTNRKKKSRLFAFHKSTSRAANSRGTNGHRDRGQEAWEDEDGFERSSGYSSESSYGYKKTPRKSVESARRSGAGRPSHSRNVSGLSYSFGPLVRASPSGQMNPKGTPTQSGDIRLPAKTQLSNASSFCSNRSRKLGDFGRFNHDH